jgi:hypothetical protein
MEGRTISCDHGSVPGTTGHISSSNFAELRNKCRLARRILRTPAQLTVFPTAPSVQTAIQFRNGRSVCTPCCDLHRKQNSIEMGQED